ncbi:MAG: Stf0 family sulfotransferase [Cyanobacteria bacterium P01_D01_bin.50]
MKENTDIAIIHLKRQNLLKSKVSAKTAQSSGNWGIGATGGLGKQQQAIQFELDFNECLQDFEAHRSMEDETDEFFSNHKKLNITYENLTEDTTNTLNRVQSFLGLETQSLVTQTKKQVVQPMTDLIINYHQLKAKFSNTVWKECFEE